MIKNLNINKILWGIISVLSLIASLTGFLNQSIYNKVVAAQWLPGTISQDIITIIAASTLLILTFFVKEKNVKLQIIILSLIFYLFYSFGIYTIERLYNSLYLLYLAIFALSFWSLIYSQINIRHKLLGKLNITNSLRYISIAFLLFIPVLFYFIWISQLIPLMQRGEKIDFAYSIYILDMAFILPAFLITAYLAIRRVGLGLVLIPIVFLKSFTLLFSVGLGGILKTYYSQSTSVQETVFYIGLSCVFLVLALAYLVKLKIS